MKTYRPQHRESPRVHVSPRVDVIGRRHHGVHHVRYYISFRARGAYLSWAQVNSEPIFTYDRWLDENRTRDKWASLALNINSFLTRNRTCVLGATQPKRSISTHDHLPSSGPSDYARKSQSLHQSVKHIKFEFTHFDDWKDHMEHYRTTVSNRVQQKFIEYHAPGLSVSR